MIHGGIIENYPDFPSNGIDFSINVNPLGYPKLVDKAIIKNLKSLNRYPDIYYRKTIENVANYLNIDSENVVLGNGSMEIIDVIIRLFDRILIDEPCFNEYKKRAKVWKKNIASFKDSELKTNDLIILGNPNNPTGELIPYDLRELYKKIRESGAFLMLDETFIEFADKEEESIILFKTFGFNSVAIIRAATKFFSLPGLRFGYGAVSKDLNEKIKSIQNPWSLNAMVEPVSEIIFKDEEYISNSKRLVSCERERLKVLYKDIKSVKMLPSSANFYLLEVKNSAKELFEFLLKEGIMARIFNEEDLKGEYLRFAIRNREDNDLLINKIKKYDKGLMI